ncbi:MAG: MMPL family transporter [Exilibacterium sp.]
MNDLLQRLEIFFERMPDRVRERRRGIWAFLVVLSAVMAAGIPHFKINMATVEYFEKDDPVRVAYDRFRAQFGGDENLYLVYEPKDKDLFSRASLRAVTALQEELLDIGRRSGPERSAALDRIVDVKTLVNATYIDTREGDLVSRQFIGTRLPRTDSDKHHLRLGALAHPDYPSLYISGDGRFGGIVIRTDIGATIAQDIILDKTAALGAIDGAAISAAEDEAAIDYDAFVEVDLRRRTPSFELAEIGDYSAVMEAVRRVLEKPQYSDHLVFHAAGNLPVMNYFDRIILEEMVIIGGLSLCVVVAVLFFLFRSLAAVVWPPVIVNLCFLWIVGLVGWSGATMTFMINIIVFLIISVGVADAVHILSGYLFFRQRGQEHRAALRSVFKKSGLACLLTSLTTSIGLLALTLVPIVPIRNFGIFAALGIMLAFVFTMVLLPLMLDLRSPYPRPRAEKNHGRLHPVQRILRKVETLGYRRPRAVVAGFLIAGAGLFYGALQVKVDSNTVELLGPDTTVRQDVDFVDATMGGVQSAEVFIDAGRAGALEDPEVLIKLEQLQNYVESRYPRRVGATHSLADVTKTTFRALNEGRDEMFRIPRDARVLQQTLAIFNNANPKDRRLLVSDDYSRARITITMKNGGTHDYIPIMDDIQATAEALFSPLKSAYPALDVRLTGSMALLIRLDEPVEEHHRDDNQQHAPHCAKDEAECAVECPDTAVQNKVRNPHGDVADDQQGDNEDGCGRCAHGDQVVRDILFGIG